MYHIGDFFVGLGCAGVGMHKIFCGRTGLRDLQDGVKTLNAYEILNVVHGATQAQIREAYRKLARRWHPDRFMAGPERDWANEKMAQINAAYRQCLSEAKADGQRCAEAEQLQKIETMIQGGLLQDARAQLMRFSTRCAEWNYLFGAVLYRLREYEKALTFLTVAMHQCPGNPKYVRAERAARDACASSACGGLRSHRFRVGRAQ